MKNNFPTYNKIENKLVVSMPLTFSYSQNTEIEADVVLKYCFALVLE